MTEKRRKVIFILILGITFVYMYACNYLTPFLADDFAYVRDTRLANSIIDLLKDEATEYFANSCRFIDMFLYRLFIYLSGDGKNVTNVVNSIGFIGLALLIYDNVPKKKKYDLYVIILTLTMLFMFLASFGETILWACGSGVYLYGILWILGFVTFYRHMLNKDAMKYPWLITMLLFFFGICAGMTNENSGGGGFLLILFFTLNKLVVNKKNNITLKNSIKPYMISAHIGMLLGIGLLVLGPGSQNRLGTMEESNYTGLAGLLSHVYKITVAMKELFTPLLFIIAITIVILVIQKYFKNVSDLCNDTGILFLFSAIAVCYVMAVMEPATYRSYFGGSVFYIVAAVSLIQNIRINTSSDEIYKVLKYSLATILCIIVIYDNSIGIINLQRINREENERIQLITEAITEGKDEVVVSNYTPEFETKFSAAHVNDMTNDPAYWINYYYEGYYGINRIKAVPREEYLKYE